MRSLDNDAFLVPHSIAVDDDLDIVCVADRENERILCYNAGTKPNDSGLDTTGVLMMKAESTGRVYAVRIKGSVLN